jgi:preprotein translocase subunit SecG
MFGFLTALLVLDALILSVAVLLQSGKGGGLAALGGGSSTDTFMGGRQATTVLTKASWWCGGIFLALSLVLSGLSTRGGVGTQSILEGQIQAPVPVNNPALPLDVNPAQNPAATDTTN